MDKRARPPRPPVSGTPTSRPTTAVAAFALCLVLAGTWAYATSFAGALVLDDVRAIARNPTIRTLWPLTVPLTPPTASTVAGRPIPNLSFALNYALAPPAARDVFEANRVGADPAARDLLLQNLWGYHLLNLAIHVAAGRTAPGRCPIGWPDARELIHNPPGTGDSA